jgi:hypothetical protein
VLRELEGPLLWVGHGLVSVAQAKQELQLAREVCGLLLSVSELFVGEV